MVEQGALDLDADVNSYLDFEIPTTYAEPITMSYLLSHTSGFENRYWNLFARVHYTLTMLAAWSFVWFVNYWHLLRW